MGGGARRGAGGGGGGAGGGSGSRRRMVVVAAVGKVAVGCGGAHVVEQLRQVGRQVAAPQLHLRRPTRRGVRVRHGHWPRSHGRWPPSEVCVQPSVLQAIRPPRPLTRGHTRPARADGHRRGREHGGFARGANRFHKRASAGCERGSRSRDFRVGGTDARRAWTHRGARTQRWVI